MTKLIIGITWLLYHQNELRRCIRESNNIQKERIDIGGSKQPVGKVDYMTRSDSEEVTDEEIQQYYYIMSNAIREKDGKNCCQRCCTCLTM